MTAPKPKSRLTVTEGAAFFVAMACVGWFFTTVWGTYGQAGRSDSSIAGLTRELDDVKVSLHALEARDCRSGK